MQFSEDILLRVAVFVLGVCGFLIARHIREHKKTAAPLVCPVGFDCHAVVHSDYSRFMGVPVELLGMIYYGVVSVAYFVFIFWNETMPWGVSEFLIGISLAAFLFSIYLIAVQIFILKKGCSWCIVSAFVSALIFILTIFAYDLGYLLNFLG
jgi:uncharacterized membrane protein